MQALNEAGLPLEKELIVSCPQGSIEEGKAATEQLLKLPNRPDAIFATNDPAAMGAMQAIKAAGLKIPQDVAVVGFSNWVFSGLLDPSLSSVDQPGFEMGQEAAKLLIRQIEVKSKDNEEPTPETKILKTKLIVRDSSLKKGK